MPIYGTPITGPSGTTLIGLDLIKQHLRLPVDEDITEDDAILTQYALNAEAIIEAQSECILRQKTRTLILSDYQVRKKEARITVYPVTSVASVTYYDSDNVSQTLDDSYYYLVSDTLPPVIRFNTILSGFPSVYDRTDAWRVNLNVGYSADEVPVAAAQAILLMVGYFYRFPEDQGKALGAIDTDRSFRACVDQLRWRTYP